MQTKPNLIIPTESYCPSKVRLFLKELYSTPYFKKKPVFSPSNTSLYHTPFSASLTALQTPQQQNSSTPLLLHTHLLMHMQHQSTIPVFWFRRLPTINFTPPIKIKSFYFRIQVQCILKSHIIWIPLMFTPNWRK